MGPLLMLFYTDEVLVEKPPRDVFVVNFFSMLLN
jgi:hypothetical protein